MVQTRKTTSFIYSVALLMCFCLACNNPNAFIIEGQIDNTEGVVLLLDKVKGTSLQLVDTLHPDKDGTFKIKGLLYETSFFAIRTNQGEMFTLIVHPGDKISLTADAKNLWQTMKTEGSPDTRLIQDFERFHNRKLLQLDSLGQLYRGLLYNSAFDSLKTSIDSTLASLIHQMRQYAEAFITANYQSFASVYVVYQQFPPETMLFDPLSDLSFYQMVDTALQRKYPGNEQVTLLHNHITQNQEKKRQLETNANGLMAPDFSIQGMAGDTLSLKQFHGKNLLLVFWASWSKPGRLKNQFLSQTFNNFNTQGLEILQISLDTRRQPWLDAISEDKLTWHHACDGLGWNSPVVTAYKVKKLPYNLLIGPEGTIIAYNIRPEKLNDTIGKILQQQKEANALQNNPAPQ